MLIELLEELGITPKKTASTHGGEYHSPCPICGGDDRFCIWPNKELGKVEGAYWCRQCGISGDTIKFCMNFCGLGFKEACSRLRTEMPRQVQRKRRCLIKKDIWG